MCFNIIGLLFGIVLPFLIVFVIGLWAIVRLRTYEKTDFMCVPRCEYYGMKNVLNRLGINYKD